MALEQAKRDAALSTAAAAAAMGTNSGNSLGFSRGSNTTQGDVLMLAFLE